MKILKPDVAPPRATETLARLKHKALVAGIGLCGITGFIGVILFVA